MLSLLSISTMGRCVKSGVSKCCKGARGSWFSDTRDVLEEPGARAPVHYKSAVSAGYGCSLRAGDLR